MATDFDIITVGGGLGGSALARAMALAGKRVLVVEAETEFRDRVRGEQMTSWGVAETKELGIHELLLKSCAHETPYWQTYIGPMALENRDLRDTTPQGCANMTFYHPAMQETLLAAAREAGATVMRGAHVRGVEPGGEPAVTVERDGKSERYTARLIVGCDGRNSSVRKWAGFATEQEPDRMQLSGLLMDGLDVPEDTQFVFLDIEGGTGSIFFPQGNGRVRTYFASRASEGPKFSGEKDIPAYTERLRTAAPAGEQWFKNAKPAGPLATFNGAESYVRRPYADGVALIGDAGGTSDPSWGQGLSLTLRSARMLREELLATDDWDAAGKSYAEHQAECFDHIRRCETWFTTFFYTPGAEADAIRGRAFPLIAQDGTRIPDTMQSGPDYVPATEEARRRFFGED
jgi:2-polyprenyl-6-methoxyphenol hydroxylase-like FAD-dependent oxidoreductase